MATHADDALRLLDDADARERHVLGAFEYSQNLWSSTPTTACFQRTGAPAASWNVRTPDCRRSGDALTMTYHMNRLQSIDGPVEYCVSLNPGDEIRPELIIETRMFSHPMYTFRTLEAQRGVADSPGPAADMVRGGPPRVRVPRGWLSVRVRGGGDDRPLSGGGGGMRSHLLEGVSDTGVPGRPRTGSSTPSTTSPSTSVNSTTYRWAPPRQPGSRNIVSFRDHDHLSPPASDLPTDLRTHLRTQGIAADGWSVTLVTSLRVLGYVFNPASFFLCRDERGTLRVVVVEVHNTYGERHLYTLRRIGDDGPFVSSMEKAFFVSPFIEMDARYAVHVRDDEDGLRIAIAERQDGAPLLSTSLVLRRVPLNDRNVLRMLLRHPLLPQRTIALIHWHAFRLWLRGVPFLHHRAARPEPEVAR